MIENQKPPVNYNIPIPNTLGDYPEVYYVSTPEGPAFLGNGLEINPETGTISSTGGGVPNTPLNTYIYSLADLGNNVLLAGGENGFVYRSENGGRTWDSGEQLVGGIVWNVSSGGGNNALMGTWPDPTYIFVSTDDGQSWAQGEDFDEEEVDAIAFAGGSTVYVGTYANVHRSDDGGLTWPQSSSPFSEDYVMCFAFPNEEEVVVGSYYYGYIAHSSDGGASWDYSDYSVLSGADWIYGMASDGNGTILAVSDDNGLVYRSTDSGFNWDGGTPLGNATALHSVAFSDGVFYVGTNDLGKIFKSTDLGTTWQLFYNPNSLNADVRAITFNQNDEIVAAINNFIVRIPKSYTPPQYIYCTSPFGNLPVTYPPYNCETAVNTTGVTDFTDAWFNCQYLTEFPCVDSSSVTDFSYAWEYCYGLTSFPTINTSAGENFTYSWAYSGLTSFPRLNTSNGSIFYGTWCGCYDLASFPDLDLSKGEDFTYAWYYCYDLASFPLLDVSSGTNFNGAWQGCSSLTSFPLIDVSAGTNFAGAWSGCTSLTSFPLLDVSSGTNFQSAWQNCYNLTSFPPLNMSSGVSFFRTWKDCTSLTSFPVINVSSGEDFRYSWDNCTSLTSFPPLNFSSGVDLFRTWNGCTSLTSFPAGMFDNCLATNFFWAWRNCALNQTSVDNILLSIDTAGQSNGILDIFGGTSAAPSATGLAAKASLEAKGWTVTTN